MDHLLRDLEPIGCKSGEAVTEGAMRCLRLGLAGRPVLEGRGDGS